MDPKRHPAGMGGAEVTQFLSALVVDQNVAASTQNQALSAILFLYRDVLEQDPALAQELLGHRDVSTTQIYTHVLNRGPSGVESPADWLTDL